MSITPKQAFEAAKVLWPSVSKVCMRPDMLTMIVRERRVTILIDAEVDWGDLTQYPPPPEEWRDAVFPDDVGKKGRFSDLGKEWHEGTICGRWTSGLWIGYATQWKFCQVKKETK